MTPRQGTSVALLAALIVGCSSAPAPSPPGASTPGTSSTPASSPAVLSPTLGAWVEVSPSAALLASIGETRRLTAQAFDAAGNASAGGTTWSSSHPDKVAVAADGTITAVAFGSAQITADIAGVESAPVLVIVTTPAAGVTLVSDEQIAGGPVAVEPSAAPSLANAYQVALTGALPAVGDLVLGTGGKPLAGRVSAVSGQTLTLQLVPLPELLPELSVNEEIDLTNAQIQLRADVARYYDITRTGNTFDFMPKPNFNELVASRLSRSALAVAGSAGIPLGGATAASGTSATPPFTECEGSTTPSSSSSPLSLSGTSAPTFSVEINPGLSVVASDGLVQKAVVTGAVKVKASAALKAAIQFEGKYGCSIELFSFVLPMWAALSAIVPIKAGVEFGGKVTLTSIEVGGELMAATTAEVGLDCTAGASGCGLHGQIGNWTPSFTPKVDGPSLDVRFQPSLEVYGGLDVKFGISLIQSLQFGLAKAKIGAALAGDWAPRPLQLADSSYASNYKLTVEGGVSAGLELGEIGQLLGLGSLTAVELKISKDVAVSPTGKLTLDRSSYVSGESGVASIKLDPANIEFLGLYNVEKVVLVRYAGGTATVLDSSPTAADGQTEFELHFNATGPISENELFAVLVTKLAPLDLFSLELERASSCVAEPMTQSWQGYLIHLTYRGTLTAPAGGETEESLYFDPTPDGDALALYFRGGGLEIVFEGVGHFEGGGWTGDLSIVCEGGERLGKLVASSATYGRFEGLSRDLPDSPLDD